MRHRLYYCLLVRIYIPLTGAVLIVICIYNPDRVIYIAFVDSANFTIRRAPLKASFLRLQQVVSLVYSCPISEVSSGPLMTLLLLSFYTRHPEI